MRDFSASASSSATARVRQSFGRGLVSYHQAATVQAQIADDLAALLGAHRGDGPLARALEFGCGTGHLTRALTKRFAIADLTLNDLVPDCANHVRATMPAGQKNAFCSGPIETLEVGAGFGLIASASVVQWIPDQRALLQNLSDRLAPGGWLALSSFGTAQFAELQALGSAACAPGYRDAGDWQVVLPEGVELVIARQDPIRLYFNSARAVLRHLRETGVNGNAQGGWTRARLADFERQYAAQFGTDQGLPLTYDAVWIVARKPS